MPKEKKLVVKNGEAESVEVPVKKENPHYNNITYILVFKVEGHTTWRRSLYPTKKAHEDYMKKTPLHPKITDQKWFEFDTITGNITEEK